MLCLLKATGIGMQNERMEPKGYPKLYIGTARGDIRLSSQHKLKRNDQMSFLSLSKYHFVVNAYAPNSLASRIYIDSSLICVYYLARGRT